ncbi:MAG: DUF1217 domain-containing protein [Hasllibacter sp.]
MTFTPALPFGGIAGWRFLQGRGDALRAAHAASPAIARAGDAFAAAAGTPGGPSAIVSDPVVRRVALTAFGLQADIPNVYFTERVLAEGADDPGALSRRLSDARYRAMAGAFGFDRPEGPRSADPDVAAAIRARFEAQSFEEAIGQDNPDLRLALTMDRELGEIATSNLSDAGKWFTVMGNPPLRAVLERALGLPESIGTLDVDRQLGEFRERAARVFGTSDLSRFADAGERDRLAVRFLAMGAAGSDGNATGSGRIALALLGG